MFDRDIKASFNAVMICYIVERLSLAALRKLAVGNVKERRIIARIKRDRRRDARVHSTGN